MALITWASGVGHRLTTIPRNEWIDALWLALFFGLVFAGFAFAGRVARRHLAVHGRRTLGYWLKMAAIILTCAVITGIITDAAELLTRPPPPKAMGETLLAPLIASSVMAVIAMPFLAVMTVLSLWLKRRFPTWFPDN